MSMTLKSETLLKYRSVQKTFIETGTYDGGTINKTITCGFDKYYGIEISGMHKDAVQTKFANQIAEKTVNLFYGDSAFLFQEVYEQVKFSPSVFWLDSHYDNNSDTKGNLDCTLYHELIIMKSNFHKQSIILIDDLRMFSKVGTWGANISLPQVIKHLKEINADFVFNFENGYTENDILVAIDSHFINN